MKPHITIFASLLIFITILFYSHFSYSWDGYDKENNTAVEIGKGNLVREGSIIKIYDWVADQYRDVEILSIEYSLNNVRLEVQDLETQKNRILDMEN